MSLRVILACFCVVEAPPTCKIALSKEQCDPVRVRVSVGIVRILAVVCRSVRGSDCFVIG